MPEKSKFNLTDEEVIQIEIKERIKEILEYLDVDTSNPNFKETPLRVAKSLLYATRGKRSEKEIKELFKTKFPTNYRGMVISKGIHVWSTCPHHLKDVEYNIDFGIIYQKEALGLSMIPRIIKLLVAQPELQENLTHLIVKKFNEELHPKGIIVQLHGLHLCMRSRGVEQNIEVITSEVSGIFDKDVAARQEFLILLKKS